MSGSRWVPAYIGIGSNLNEPIAQVSQSFDVLAALPSSRLIAQSSLYRSPPLGPQDQPPYVNAVAGLLTQLDANALLMELKSHEGRLGRTTPVVRWGPRVIDFDLLLFGSTRIDSANLKVPHPGIAERAFVLLPLAEIAPELDVPGWGSVRLLASRIDATGIEQL